MLNTKFFILRCTWIAFAVCTGWAAMGQPITLVTTQVVTPQELLDSREGWEVHQFEPLRTAVGSDAHSRFEGVLREVEVLDLAVGVVADLRAQAPYTFEMPVPRSAGPDLALELVAVRIFTHDYSVETASGTAADGHPVGYHYWGVIQGVPGSWVALSVFEDEIMGVLHHPDEGTMTLGKAMGGAGQYLLYRNRDEVNPRPLSSATHLQSLVGGELESDGAGSTEKGSDQQEDKIVRVHLEADYDLYRAEGSVEASLKMMEGVMNVVALVYTQVDVRVLLSESKVWTKPAGFAGSDSQEALESFAKQTPDFKGDVACLLSGGASTAGAAFVSGMGRGHESGGPYAYVPVPDQAVGYPSYSLLTQAVASELGHSMGAQHRLWPAGSGAGSGTIVQELGGLERGAGFAVQASEDIRSFVSQSHKLTGTAYWAEIDVILGCRAISSRKWVCVDGWSAPQPLVCNREDMGAWEEFTFSNSRYDNETTILWKGVANWANVQAGHRAQMSTSTNSNLSLVNFHWRFNWYSRGTKCTITSIKNGRYVSHENGTKQMTCNRTKAKPWERFQLFERNSKTRHFPQADEEAAVTVYPNPAANYLQLEGVAVEDELEVYNVQGQRLMQARGVASLDLAPLASGMYFLKVNQEQTIRFIKQ